MVYDTTVVGYLSSVFFPSHKTSCLYVYHFNPISSNLLFCTSCSPVCFFFFQIYNGVCCLEQIYPLSWVLAHTGSPRFQSQDETVKIIINRKKMFFHLFTCVLRERNPFFKFWLQSDKINVETVPCILSIPCILCLFYCLACQTVYNGYGPGT